MSLSALAGVVIAVVLASGFLYWRRRAETQRMLASTMHALSAQADALLAEPQGAAKRRADVAEQFRAATREAPENLGRASQALWMALLSGVVADKTIDNREIFNVADLYSQITGKTLEPQFVLNAAHAAAERPSYAIDEIGKASVSLSLEEKRIVLQAACLIVVSDERVDASEATRLLAIAQALGLPKDAGLAAIERESPGP